MNQQAQLIKQFFDNHFPDGSKNGKINQASILFQIGDQQLTLINQTIHGRMTLEDIFTNAHDSAKALPEEVVQGSESSSPPSDDLINIEPIEMNGHRYIVEDVREGKPKIKNLGKGNYLSTKSPIYKRLIKQYKKLYPEREKAGI